MNGQREAKPVTAAARIADAVYEQLKGQIFDGELQSGARLSVPALAEKLRVSRSPVRDAVLRLIKDRLAREEPRRGAVVAHVGPAELAGLYEVREVLEGLAAKLAVENAGRRLVERLREVVDEHERAIELADLDGHAAVDMRFHALVRQASANPEVIRMLDDIQTRVRLAMRTTTVTGGPRNALEDHRAILAAIETGDPDKAEHAARAHIARLRSALRERMEEAE